MNEQIASESEELDAVANEIEQNVINVNRAAEVNADNTRGVAATEERLSALTRRMQDNISRFVL